MFIFGVDAMPNLVKIAESIDSSDWQLLEKIPKYEVKTKKRTRPQNVKEQIVKLREFKKIQTVCEHVAEFEYRPGKCKKTYRIVVLRKQLHVIKGEQPLFDDIRSQLLKSFSFQ